MRGVPLETRLAALAQREEASLTYEEPACLGARTSVGLLGFPPEWQPGVSAVGAGCMAVLHVTLVSGGPRSGRSRVESASGPPGASEVCLWGHCQG